MDGRMVSAESAVAAFLAAQIAPAAPDRIGTSGVPAIQRAGWTGWRFWVTATALRDSERLARRRVKKEIRLLVEVETKYDQPAQPGEEGRVPVAWINDQTNFVEAEIYEAINNKAVRTGDLLADRFRMENCAWMLRYDANRLHEDKVFISLIEITLTEMAEG